MKSLMFLTLLSVIALAFSPVVYGEDLVFESLYQDVKSISTQKSVLVPSLNSPSRKIPFRYLTYPARFHPNNFTILILPGGPGGNSSDNMIDMHALPNASAQYIFVDPRGTGLNFKMGEASAKKLSTVVTVADVVEIIRSKKLTNYVLWGSSYGTVVATQLGFFLQENPELIQPKAIVLEGTLGKAIEFSKDYYESIPFRFKDFYAHLPPSSAQLVKRYRQVQNNKALMRKNLVQLFQQVAYYGKQAKFEAFDAELQTLIDDPTRDLNASSDRTYSQLFPHEKQAYINMHILCNEIVKVNSVSDQKKFRFGKYVMDAVAPCVPPLNNPNLYDANKFRITQIPLVYIQGFEDYQTPLVSALDHFRAQIDKSPGSSFTLFLGTGHSVFRNAFTNCQIPFVNDLKRGEFGLKSTKQCARRNGGKFQEYL